VEQLKNVLIAAVLITLAGGAADAGLAVVGGLSRIASAEPGEELEHEILLRNSEDTDILVRIYPTDYIFFADGRSVYGEPGTMERSNAGWFTLSTEWITVPARGEAAVYYRGRLPAGEALSGTYWSLLMVEPLGPPGARDIPDQHGRPSISLATQIRYGVQIITDVGETGTPDLRFLDRRLISGNGHNVLQLDVENAGDKWVYPITWVEVYDEAGCFVGRFESTQKRIFPGCSVRHEFDLSEVAEGKYTALVIIDNSDEHVFGAQYRLELEP
jgi:hypothetical protein